mgnify:CR=1 FL=1|jgi:hypothetical protein
MNIDAQISNMKTIASRKDFTDDLHSLWSQLSIIKFVEDHNDNAKDKEIPDDLKQHYTQGFLASQTTNQTIEIYPVPNTPTHIDFAYSRAKEQLKTGVSNFDKIISIKVRHLIHPTNDSIAKVIGTITFTTSFN